MLPRQHAHGWHAIAALNCRLLVRVHRILSELGLERRTDSRSRAEIALRRRHDLQHFLLTTLGVGLLAIRFPRLLQVLVALLHAEPRVAADLVLLFPYLAQRLVFRARGLE